MIIIQAFFSLLAAPYLALWEIITTRKNPFKDNGGHTSGLCSGLLEIVTIVGLLLNLVIFIVGGLIIAFVLDFSSM